MSKDNIEEFAREYTAAWCSRDPQRMAAFFEEDGTLIVNDGEPKVGRAAIAGLAEEFMVAFPDLVLLFDGLDSDGDRVIFRWTFVGTNSGPGGTGNAVRFSGFERWTMGPNGLVSFSGGNFDPEEYERQLQHGAPR